MLRNAQYIEDNVLISDEENTTLKYCKKTTGVDLSVKNIYAISTPGIITKNKTYVSNYNLVPPKNLNCPIYENNLSKEQIDIYGWYLKKGTYIIELNEGCRFSDKDAGYIILRSSLNRNGVTLQSALWDNGFTTQDDAGKIHGMSCRLIVDTDVGVYIEKNARVGQLLVFDAPLNGELYNNNGHQFQGRGLK